MQRVGVKNQFLAVNGKIYSIERKAIKDKIPAVLIISSIIIVLGSLFFYVGPNRIGKTSPPPTISTKLEKPEVTLTLHFKPDDIATVSTAAKTPYEALMLVTEAKGIRVNTNTYDFGLFVEGIRDIHNNREKAWIYYVNGTSGNVASDKYALKSGDQVEWKYTDVKNE